jgi:SAM-dependent methyltransferase
MASLRDLPSAIRHWQYTSALQARTWLSLRARLRTLGIEPARRRILDVGCGELYPYTLLFHSVRMDVIGIDLSGLRPRSVSARRMREGLHRHGLRRTLRTMVSDLSRRVLFDRPLGRNARVRIKYNGLKLRQTDVTRLDLPSESVDLIVSFAAVEHILDIPRAASEMRRVLTPGGIAHLNIHLWSSLSGGHEKEFWNGGIPPNLSVPWKHLRDPNWTSDIPLNRWRREDYLKVFRAHFEVVTSGVETELGRELLTAELLAALPGYAPDELATEMWVLVLRKPLQ